MITLDQAGTWATITIDKVSIVAYLQSNCSQSISTDRCALAWSINEESLSCIANRAEIGITNYAFIAPKNIAKIAMLEFIEGVSRNASEAGS